MFTLIQNYRSMLLACIKNDLDSSPKWGEWEQLNSDSFKWDALSDLKALNKAISDGKIDSEEAKIISENMNEINEEAKSWLTDLANSMLEKGFSVMKKPEYNSFRSILEKSWIKIPDWETIKKKLDLAAGEDTSKNSDDFHGITVKSWWIDARFDLFGLKDTIFMEYKWEEILSSSLEMEDNEEIDTPAEWKVDPSILEDNIEERKTIIEEAKKSEEPEQKKSEEPEQKKSEELEAKKAKELEAKKAKELETKEAEEYSKIEEVKIREAKKYYERVKASPESIKKIQAKLNCDQSWVIDDGLILTLSTTQEGYNLEQDSKAWTKTLRKLGLISSKETAEDFYSSTSKVENTESNESERLEKVRALIKRYKDNPKYSDNGLIANLYNTKVWPKDHKTTDTEMKEFKLAMDNLDKQPLKGESNNESSEVKKEVSELDKEYNEYVSKLEWLTDSSKYSFIIMPNNSVYRVETNDLKNLQNTENAAALSNYVYWLQKHDLSEEITNVLLYSSEGKFDGLNSTQSLIKLADTVWADKINMFKPEKINEYWKAAIKMATFNIAEWSIADQSIESESFKSDLQEEIDDINEDRLDAIEDLVDATKLDNYANSYYNQINEIVWGVEDLDDMTDFIEKLSDNKDLYNLLEALTWSDLSDISVSEIWKIKSLVKNEEKTKEWIKKYIDNKSIEGAFIIRNGEYVFNDSIIDKAIQWDNILKWNIRYNDWKDSKEEELYMSVNKLSKEEKTEVMTALGLSKSGIKLLEGKTINVDSGKNILFRNGEIIIIWNDISESTEFDEFLTDSKNNLSSSNAKYVYAALAWAALAILYYDGLNAEWIKTTWEVMLEQAKSLSTKDLWSELTRWGKDIEDVFSRLDPNIKVGKAWAWLLAYMATSFALNKEIASMQNEIDNLKWENYSDKVLSSVLKEKWIDKIEENISVKVYQKLHNKFGDTYETNHISESWDNWAFVMFKEWEAKYTFENADLSLINATFDKEWNIVSAQISIDENWAWDSSEMDNIYIDKKNDSKMLKILNGDLNNEGTLNLSTSVIESKTESKTESKVESKTESKAESKTESKIDLKKELEGNSILSDLTVTYTDKNGKERTATVKFKVEWDKLILDSSWDQPGTDKEVVITKEDLEDNTKLLLKKDGLANAYKKQINN